MLSWHRDIEKTTNTLQVVRLAREYLENNQYAGPVPVPLFQYSEVVRRQRLAENWLSPAALKGAFKHLVVEQDISDAERSWRTSLGRHFE
jgi:hypothetical protein